MSEFRLEGRTPGFGSITMLNGWVSTACGAVCRQGLRACAALAMLCAALPTSHAATLDNTAEATFSRAGVAMTLDSNTVTLLTVPPPSPAVVTFWQSSPNAATDQIRFDGGSFQDSNGTFIPLSNPSSLTGQPIGLADPVPVRETTVYHAGEPVFITLADANRNLDPEAREFLELTLTSSTGDTEILRLQETGPDTGVFATVVQSHDPDDPQADHDGRIAVDVDTTLNVHYEDPFYPDDVVDDNALVDPFGIVFDSVTGEPIDGATVTVINADTGEPAIVFGDDGLSAYPATNVTGGSVTDSSGQIYQFPPGGYRFPFMYPGNYQFIVQVPPGYTVPSIVDPGALPNDPNGDPYAIVLGSYLEVFVIVPGPALNIDIPADPPSNVLQTLTLQKAVSQPEASAGDFLQYTLQMDNRDPNVDATNAVITDVLPDGLRYQASSLRVDGQPAAEPTLSADGRTLTFGVGTVPAGGTVSVRYVVQVETGTPNAQAVNEAVANADGGVFSNTALATVRIKEPLMRGAFTIIGRVIDDCAERQSVPEPVCTATAVEAPQAPTQVFTVKANFDSGRATLKPAGRSDLDGLARTLAAVDIERIELIGHTDSQRVGNPRTVRLFGDNYGLSKARAQAVGDYLAHQLGLAPGQVSAAGKGPDEPVASNATPAGMARNRRTEVKVYERRPEGATVFEEMCDDTTERAASPASGDGRGVPDVRLYLEDGTFVNTDRNGQFHFEGVRPGTHVVQLDYDTLPDGYRVVPRIQNSRFAGRAYSRFVEAGGGALWRTDFFVCAAPADAGIRLQSLAGGEVKQSQVSRPRQAFTFRGKFDSGRATLRPESRAELDALLAQLRQADVERLEVVGHTDSQRLGAKTALLFGDNDGLSRARAQTIADALGPGLGLSASAISVDGRGFDQPVASNATAAGMAQNRRVEVIVHGRAQVANEVTTTTSDFVHRVTLDGRGVPATNLRLAVTLPNEERYLPGTTHLNGQPFDDPTIQGNVLRWTLGNPGAFFEWPLEFAARAVGERRSRRDDQRFTFRGKFDSGRATLRSESRSELEALLAQLKQADIERLEIVGHTDSQRVGNPETVRLFRDNNGLSRARAQTIADFLGPGLGLASSAITVDGRGFSEPVASNATPAGMAQNRRVEVIVHGRGESQTHVREACPKAGYFGIQAVATFDTEDRRDVQLPLAENRLVCGYVQSGGTGGGAAEMRDSGDSGRKAMRLEWSDAAAQTASDARRDARRSAAASDQESAGTHVKWLEGAAPGIAWRFPEEGHNPRAPATRVVVQHAPGQSVELRVNGDGVPPLALDGTDTNAAKTVAVTKWRAIPLHDGENVLTAEVRGRSGNVVQTLSRKVHFANTIIRAELVPDRSHLVADGVHRPVIAVKFFDRDGQPARQGSTGAYSVNPPYVPWEAVAHQQDRQLAGLDQFSPTFHVEDDDGIAFIELAPTSETGNVMLNFDFTVGRDRARMQELRAWLEPAARDWIIVGFGEGTVGYNTLKDNIQPLLDAGDEEGVYTEGQLAFFAKGRVLGEWLLTIAYDTDKPTELERRRGLLSTIDPNEYYTLYGDGTGQAYDASSQDKLYLKLERGQFYALFGDYTTGLTVTELSRYSRTLNGLKTELGGPVNLTAFASETAQDFARDEIRGDGTSGLYQLSRNNIVINSEQIRIEVRDRFRSEQIVRARQLQRHIDYDIDYAAGTIFFREPVFSRDAEFNPIYIIAEYETFGLGEEEVTGGGRVGIDILGGALQAGVSAIHEEQVGQEADLVGADVKLRLGDALELRVEAAESESQGGATLRDGQAWLAELEQNSGRVSALLYARSQESGFGLSQQNRAERGTEKVGADAQFRMTERWSVLGRTWQQETETTQATRNVADARLQFESQGGRAYAGYQVAADESGFGERFESEQVTFGLARRFFSNRLELSGGGDLSTGDESQSLDFPERYRLGASWALTPGATLFASQEFTDGAVLDTSLTRAGLQATPWAGATLNTTVNQEQISEFGPRTFAQYGLTQSLVAGERWGASLSVDSSQNLNRPTQAALVVNPSQENAVTGGALTEEFVAVSSGLTYRADLWSWNARSELRHGRAAERNGAALNFLRQAEEGVAFAAHLALFRQQQDNGIFGRNGRAGLAWAWRPLGSRWSILDRLEFRYDSISNPTGTPNQGLFGRTSLSHSGEARTRRFVNNFVVNRVSREWTEEDRKGNLFRLFQRNQWSFYYGAKYSLDTFDGVEYSGYTDLTGLEVRHDLTRHWDIGLQAAALHVWDPGTWQYSVGPSIGWTPVTNAWLSLGYNLRGFRDPDFQMARYTAEGPFLKLRFKFDQNTRIPGRDRTPPESLRWSDLAEEPEAAYGTTAAAAGRGAGGGRP